MNKVRAAASTGVGIHAGIAALAGFFFAVKPMITLVSVRVLGLTAQDGSALRLATTIALFGFMVLATLGSVTARTSFTPPVKWAFGFLALAGCSFLWSEASSPAASAAYLLGTACELGIVLSVLRGSDADQTAAALMKGFVAGALGVAVIAWAMPTQYDLRLGDEEYLNANNIAYVCAFAAFFVQYLMRDRGRRGWGWVLFFLAATILRSLSKATTAAFLVSETWLLIKDRSMQRRTRVLLAGGAMVLLVVFSGLYVAYFGIYTTEGNQAETLTGRTAIWAWAFSEGLERPWLGHGFDAMWKVAPVFGTFEARHAENELLQQFYAFGVAGIVVLAGCYGSLWRAIAKAGNDPRRAILASIVIFVAVRGLAEAEPFDLLLPVWMVAVIATAAAAGQLPMPRHSGSAAAPELTGPNVIPL